MVDRADWLTESLKTHDRELYCEKHREGKLCVYRNSKRWESYQLDDGSIITVARSAPFFVFALTHNWRMDGNPVEWGYIPILNRLNEIDTQRRDMVSELEAQYEIAEKSERRQKRNQIEDGLRESYSKIKKSFSDVRTCNMEKVDNRRRKTKWEL